MNNIDMNEKIDELTELALTASIRGWQGLSLSRPCGHGTADNWHVVNNADTMVSHCFDFCRSTSKNSEAAARFIAAASPETVLYLIEELESARREIAMLSVSRKCEKSADKAPIFIGRKMLTKLIGCRYDTIDRMVDKGELPRPIRLGRNGHHRFIRAEIIPALLAHGIDIERLAVVHGVDLNGDGEQE